MVDRTMLCNSLRDSLRDSIARILYLYSTKEIRYKDYRNGQRVTIFESFRKLKC